MLTIIVTVPGQMCEPMSTTMKGIGTCHSLCQTANNCNLFFQHCINSITTLLPITSRAHGPKSTDYSHRFLRWSAKCNEHLNFLLCSSWIPLLNYNNYSVLAGYYSYRSACKQDAFLQNRYYKVDTLFQAQCSPAEYDQKVCTCVTSKSHRRPDRAMSREITITSTVMVRVTIDSKSVLNSGRFPPLWITSWSLAYVEFGKRSTLYVCFFVLRQYLQFYVKELTLQNYQGQIHYFEPFYGKY